jgi:nitroreductase
VTVEKSMSSAVLELLATRRSLKPDKLVAPGPTQAQLDQILTIAARVPDHKKLAPWRFIIFEGDARARMGEVFARACEAEDTQPPSPIRLATERQRLLRSPTVIAVVSRIVEKPGAPEWEQVLSAGACCYNMCLAANALGFGSCWITEWVSYSPTVRAALTLASNERLAGFIYLGTRTETPSDRDRPNLADLVSRWPAQ